MAHFIPARASLFAWQANASVTATEFWKLDENGSKGINGDDGGIWAPSAAITIGGQGVVLTGPSIIDDCRTLTMTEGLMQFDATSRLRIGFGAELELQNGAVFKAMSGSEVTFNGGSTTEFASGAQAFFRNGSSVTAENNVAFELQSGAEMVFDGGALLRVLATGEIAVEGELNIKSGGSCVAESGAVLGTAAGAVASFGGATTVSGATTFTSGGSVVLAGPTTRQGKLTLSGSGARTARRTHSVANAHATIGVDTCDFLFWQCTDGNSYNITLKVSSPAPSEGESITIRLRHLGAGECTVIDGGSSLAVYNFTAGSAGSGSAEFVFIGGRWRPFGGVEACYTSES